MIGTYCLLEATEFLESGIASLHSRRTAVLWTIARKDNALGFAAVVAAFVVIGLFMLATSIWAIAVLVRPSTRSANRLRSQMLMSIEREAPSGLRPLWIGFAIAIACFVGYALVLGR